MRAGIQNDLIFREFPAYPFDFAQDRELVERLVERHAEPRGSPCRKSRRLWREITVFSDCDALSPGPALTVTRKGVHLRQSGRDCLGREMMH
jgi:hypothetical protein